MKRVFPVSSLIVVFLFSGIALGRIGGGNIVFTPQKAGEVIFSHDSHVSNAGLKCTDCHASLYNTKEKHRKVTMAQMQAGQSCGACHKGEKAFSVKENCNTCHQK